MQNLDGGPVGAPGMVDRVKAILLKPNEEWARIDAEPATIPDLYRSYVVPLAAIWPVCSLIGLLLLGSTYLFKLMIGQLILGYVLMLIMIYVFAVIIDTLAPNFKGASNRVQAFKVAAYSATAAWVAGVFGLIPFLGVLVLLGAFYSLYLLYLGLPRLMKVPQDQAVTYTVVVVIVGFVIALIAGGITTTLARMLAPTPVLTISDGTVSGTVAGIDLSKLQAASKQIESVAKNAEAAAKGAPNAPVGAIDPNALQGLLPAALSGFEKTGLSSASGGAAGLGGSRAEARYGSGANAIRLSVTDMGAAGAFAALGSAFNVQSSKEDENGYEKMGKVDGRMTTEKWNKASSSGSYGVLVGDRFMVEAEGQGTSIDSLKAAVAQINFGTLEQLAKS
jgi:hypothetical protein